MRLVRRKRTKLPRRIRPALTLAHSRISRRHHYNHNQQECGPGNRRMRQSNNKGLQDRSQRQTWCHQTFSPGFRLNLRILRPERSKQTQTYPDDSVSREASSHYRRDARQHGEADQAKRSGEMDRATVLRFEVPRRPAPLLQRSFRNHQNQTKHANGNGSSRQRSADLREGIPAKVRQRQCRTAHPQSGFRLQKRTRGHLRRDWSRGGRDLGCELMPVPLERSAAHRSNNRCTRRLNIHFHTRIAELPGGGFAGRAHAPSSTDSRSSYSTKQNRCGESR